MSDNLSPEFHAACGTVHDWRVTCAANPVPLEVMAEKRKDRPGDQPLPVPSDGPSMHDLVCADLEARWTARLSPRIVADMQARKQLGLERYKTLLQADNGRDSLLDLYEELEDAVAYAKQVQVERGGVDISTVYDSLITALIVVRRLRDA